MLDRIQYKESISFLTLNDKYLTDILGDYHGELFKVKSDDKEISFLCSAMMMFLEIDDNNVVHAYFYKEKSNIIITAYHCLEKQIFSHIYFKNSKSQKVYKLL